MTDAIGKPELEVVGDVFRFTWPCGIEAELDRFSEHRDELTGELLIRSSRPPSPGLIHSARFNLMSTTARKTLAGALRDRDSDLDWPGLLEQLCFLARERYRKGDPSIDMRTYAPSGRARWLVEPFVEHGGPTVLFGDGEGGKSMMAIAIGVTCATGTPVLGELRGDHAPVLYLDYETDADTFHERLRAICAGAEIPELPPFHYRRQVASLRDAAPAIRREIAKLGVGLVIVDSLGWACGDDPLAADVVIALFNTMRSFGVPVLGVDHIAKNATDQGKAFGSVYKHNGPRLTWRVDKTQEEGASSFVVALVNTKRNNGRRVPRRGHRISCVSTDVDERLIAVQFQAADLVRDFPEKATLAQRILAELGQAGALQPTDLTDRLGADPVQVRARLHDLERATKIVRLEDRRVALAARSS